VIIPSLPDLEVYLETVAPRDGDDLVTVTLPLGALRYLADLLRNSVDEAQST
jgi:hypothetical protein